MTRLSAALCLCFIWSGPPLYGQDSSAAPCFPILDPPTPLAMIYGMAESFFKAADDPIALPDLEGVYVGDGFSYPAWVGSAVLIGAHARGKGESTAVFKIYSSANSAIPDYWRDRRRLEETVSELLKSGGIYAPPAFEGRKVSISAVSGGTGARYLVEIRKNGDRLFAKRTVVPQGDVSGTDPRWYVSYDILCKDVTPDGLRWAPPYPKEGRP